MARSDALGLFWQDMPSSRKRGERDLGPLPEIPETGWRPPTEMPNIRHAKWLSIDCETYDPELTKNGPGWARGKGHICGISVAVDGGKWYFPMRHEVQKELNLDAEMVLRWARWAFGGTGVKIGANFLYDIGWLAHEGVTVEGQLYDCQYAEALLNETSKLALDELGWKYLRERKETDILKPWAQGYYLTGEKTWRKDIYRCPVTMVGPYAEQDAVLPQRVLMEQWGQIQQRGLNDLFHMECDLINLLVAMRFQGVTVDVGYASQLYDELGEEQKRQSDIMKHIVGFEVNTNSASDLERAFQNLGLSYGRTEPTEANPEGNPSFTADFLKTVDHDFARAVLAEKSHAKIRGTFLKSYILDSHIPVAGTNNLGKVYCSFNPVSGTEGGTRTGRFSSSNPNLQNIPTRTEIGARIREAFVMDYGHKHVRDYDYSQIEYRMLAHFATGAGAAEVRAKYWSDPNLDYHDMIGELIFLATGIKLKRGYVKNINFGLVYGLGKDALAEALGVAVKEANDITASFHKAVPFARSTMEALTEEVNRSGIVTTILGRQSHFDLWEPAGYGKKGNGFPLPYKAALDKWGTGIMRAYLYRALNYRLQGSAADLMKKAMVRCWKEGVFAVTGVPRLTVHDELFFSEPEGIPDEGWAEMKNIMENCIPGINVPIRADFGVGCNWRVAH